MKILLVVEPGIDGVFRHVEGLAHYLIEAGDTVFLAYSDKRGSPQLDELVALVQRRGGAVLNLRVTNSPGPADIVALVRLRGFVRRHQPDIIHGHSSKAGVLARALRILGVRQPIFYTAHAYYGLVPRKGLKSRFFNFVEWLFGRVGVSINISRDEAAFAERKLNIPPERIRVIHNPVDSSLFTPATMEQRNAARLALKLPTDRIVLGAIGRSSFQKDPQTLYRAVAPVLHEEENLVLFHVGKGEMDDELAELAKELGIADRVIRLPYLDAPAVFYHAVDALIITSRYEAGWPIVMLEALASDLPVITSNAPGMSDCGAAGLSHCWVAGVGDADGFADAVRRWLASIAAETPSNHRAKAIERFSLDRCFGSVREEYEKVIRHDVR